MCPSRETAAASSFFPQRFLLVNNTDTCGTVCVNMWPTELESVGLVKRFSSRNRLATEILTKTVFCVAHDVLVCPSRYLDNSTNSSFACLVLSVCRWSRPFLFIWPMPSRYRHKFNSVNKAAGQNPCTFASAETASCPDSQDQNCFLYATSPSLNWDVKFLHGSQSQECCGVFQFSSCLTLQFVQFCIIRYLIKVHFEKITHKHVHKCC